MEPNKLKELADHLKAQFEKPTHEMGSDLEGFHNLMKETHPEQDVETSSAPVKGYCSGGQVSGGIGGYADGGIVGDDGSDFLKSLNSGSIDSLKFNPMSGMPPQPPQMPVSQPITPQVNTQSPQDYLGAQKAQLNRFGPDQQLALSNHLTQQQSGLGSRVPVALGGLADSIMQGVARAGSGGFADRIQGQQNRLADTQTAALQNADKSNLEHQQAGMKLDEMDPSSQLSKVAQQTWGPLLSRNGFKSDQIMNMPASSIAALTGQTVEALKAESEAKMAAATLGLKTQEAAQTAKHQTAEEQTATEKERLDAAGKLAGRGMFKKATDAIFGDPGSAALEEKLGNTSSTNTSFTPDVVNYAQTHNISPEQANQIKMRRTGGQ